MASFFSIERFTVPTKDCLDFPREEKFNTKITAHIGLHKIGNKNEDKET